MDVQREVLAVLDEVLGMAGRASRFGRDQALLGALPELDSMAVVSIIAGLEDRLGLAIADDEIDGEMFATVGSLVDFVGERLGG